MSPVTGKEDYGKVVLAVDIPGIGVIYTVHYWQDNRYDF